ncbi:MULTISPECIES: 3-hydroxybenzoate 6-monooxygenase [unclassified Streptomyces]|uniref:3-hydroxybenzoate 6-monooxygenase n=1 Tax=unclassified Streptomyces TaxID=2593676 RepID=UPI0022524B1F|nr:MULTISPECIES: 3-hydroxybenzoate 6-monooxygenase [unclassified Streptomyces]MCX5146610.1 3-hydroxybenzoate 6-monooxygenase [Streptomyces sp. NBC_00320]WSN49796.1 3-hydroxybenzoate 6-monooxygenase [Streptomyces sp. NBC_01296]
MADILIAGGGIGGLAAALGLAKRGHQVTVLERRDVFTEVGAGIQLGPNAFHALDLLGVGQEVRDRAVFIDELRFMDGTTGEKVAAMPVKEKYRGRFGNPYAVVHRVDLYLPLLEAARRHPGIELLGRHHVVAYEQKAGAVCAVLADGRRLTGDALIGADGLHSAIRQQMVGDGSPRVSGHTIYRSVIPMEEVPEELRWNTVTLWAGPKWHFVHYPIAGGEHFNLAATRDDGATEAVAGLPAEHDHVVNSFPELSGAARRLLELGRDWKSWVLCDRDPVDRWTEGRVALLGDAAHPMLQYAAQGACQAIEDAVLLSGLLDGCPADFEQRLEKYNAARRERTAQVQLVAREMGRQLYHAAGEARVERNAMLASLSDDDMYDKVAWLHGAYDFDRLTAGS